MKKYKTLLFDFDGVLVDSKEISFEATNYALSKLKIPNVSKEEFDRHSKYELVKKRKLGFIKILILLFIAKRFIAKHIHEVIVNQNILHEISKITLPKVIISSNSTKNIQSSLGDQSMQFTKIIGNMGFSNKAKKLNQFKDGLYFTDEVRDILECKKAGIDVCAVTWGFDSKEELLKSEPTYLIENDKDFISLLSKHT